MKNKLLTLAHPLATGLLASLALLACTLPEGDESQASSSEPGGGEDEASTELVATSPFCDALKQIFGTPTPSVPVVLFDQPGGPANFLPELGGALLSDHGYIAFTSRSCELDGAVTLRGRQLTIAGTPAGATVVGSSFVWILRQRPNSDFLDASVEELRTGETVARQSTVYGLVSPGELTLIPRAAADTLYPQVCTGANPARGCWYEVVDRFHGTTQRLTTRGTSFSVFTFDDSGVFQLLLSAPDSAATRDPS
jgi:hypothetical protein